MFRRSHYCRGISITPRLPGATFIEELKEILIFVFDVRSRRIIFLIRLKRAPTPAGVVLA
jgi:hypothetical protein